MPDELVSQLEDDGNLYGLVRVLRDRTNPERRKEAAEALGNMGDMEVVEYLARAILQDPSLEVQKSARQALGRLVGIDAETVISTYRHHLSVTGHWGDASAGQEEEYLQNLPVRVGETGVDEYAADDMAAEGEAAEDSEALSEWDLQNLDGILTVLAHETNPKIRLRAIRSLNNSSSMRAIETLSTIALQDDIPEIRQAARDVLEKRFGEDAEAIIQSYRFGSQDEGDLDEDQETEEMAPEDDEEPYEGPVEAPRPVSSFGNYNPSSVIQEDRIGWKVILLVLLGILIVGGIAFLLFFR